MPYERLPPDCERQLDFEALIETLRLLEGETVVAAVEGGRMLPSPLVVKGPLRYLGPEEGDRTERFLVGEADLSFHPVTVSEADLHVHDGTEFFQFAVLFDSGTRIVIGDPETC